MCSPSGLGKMARFSDSVCTYVTKVAFYVVQLRRNFKAAVIASGHESVNGKYHIFVL